MSFELKSLLICRLCGSSEQKSSNFIDIFKEQRFGEQIVEILLKYLPFQVNETDTESHFICTKCWTTFEHFHGFIEYIRSCQIQMVNIKCEIADEFSTVGNVIKSEINFDNKNDGEDDDNDKDNNDFIDCNNINDNDNDSSTSSESKPLINSSDKQTTFIKIDNESDIKKIQSKSESPPAAVVILPKPIRINPCKKPDSRRERRRKRRIERDIEKRKVLDFYQLECQECNNIVDKFDTFELLRMHYLKVHNNKRGYISCCNKKLYVHSEFLEHMEWHTNPDKFKCSVCHKPYSDKARLREHMQLHSNNKKVFICDICGKNYFFRLQFVQHFRSVHLSERNNECPECGKCFLQKSVLQSHIRNIHENAGLHVCDICAKIYRSKYHYQLHRINEHEPESSRPARLECHLCGALLKHKHSLKSHMIRKHEGIVQSCPQCGKMYSNVQSLKRHIKFVHTDKPIHVCTWCEKAFKQPNALKEHIATHTGEANLYTCSYCTKTFNSRANMHRHQKNGHPNEWLRNKQKNNTRKLDGSLIAQ